MLGLSCQVQEKARQHNKCAVVQLPAHDQAFKTLSAMKSAHQVLLSSMCCTLIKIPSNFFGCVAQFAIHNGLCGPALVGGHIVMAAHTAMGHLADVQMALGLSVAYDISEALVSMRVQCPCNA